MLFAKLASRRRETLILGASLASGQFLQKVKNQLQVQIARRGCLWVLPEPLGRLWNAAGFSKVSVSPTRDAHFSILELWKNANSFFAPFSEICVSPTRDAHFWLPQSRFSLIFEAL